MKSNRLTNILLLTIALLLGAILGQRGTVAILPSAQAQQMHPSVVAYGCYFPGDDSSNPCANRPLRVDAGGRLILSPHK